MTVPLHSEVSFGVVDSTPPTVICPSGNEVVADNGTNEANYTWSVTATDDQTAPGDIFVSCVPPPGSRFKFGRSNRVVCTAVDAAGNVGVCKFSVRVTGTVH